MNDTALRLARLGARAILCAWLLAAAADVFAQFALEGLMGTPARGFASVTASRTFSFPRDHGAHPNYRTEWWYATGRLTTDTGRQFGVQLTLFRYGLRPLAQRSDGDSAWRADAVWMGHLAISDVAARTFHSAEVFARGARVGVAGASVTPTKIWLKNWTFTHDDERRWRLRAAHDDMRVDIDLSARKPLVLQGDEGLSRKSAAPGAASYYYAYTRLEGSGRIQLGAQRFAGSMRMWLDREWSSSALAPDQVGWDWFGLHLRDGRDLMLYRLRKADGTVDPFSAGAVVEADGRRTALGARDFALVPAMPERLGSGRRYPLRWRVRVPAHALDLTVSAAFAEQEHTGAVAYWEGLVDVTNDNGEVAGHGYLEMTGYSTEKQLSSR